MVEFNNRGLASRTSKVLLASPRDDDDSLAFFLFQAWKTVGGWIKFVKRMIGYLLTSKTDILDNNAKRGKNDNPGSWLGWTVGIGMRGAAPFPSFWGFGFGILIFLLDSPNQKSASVQSNPNVQSKSPSNTSIGNRHTSAGYRTNDAHTGTETI
jgi:hypothetical protein